MHSENVPFYNFTSRHRLIKSIDMLVGIIEGIGIDHEINAKEIQFLNNWLDSQTELKDRHPYNELIPKIEAALEDQILQNEEKEDILWLCQKLTENAGDADIMTKGIRNLHGILAGIIADGVITENEIIGLREWISNHEYLKTCWPFDEINSLITTVMEDKVIDSEEHKMLLNFFSEFIALEDDKVISKPPVAVDGTISGLCAITPEIVFENRLFCLTGTSFKYKRDDFKYLIQRLGGSYSDQISKKTSYLIVGADGNPCWQYACYGRKVEKAVQLRKSGSNLLIIHENDFHDAVMDLGSE